MATYPDINAELQTVHQQFPDLLRINTHDSGAEFCWRAAKHINRVSPNDRWGLLSKTPPEGGGWVGGVYVSHDVLVHQRTGLQFDVIGSGGSGSPTSPGQHQPIDPKHYRPSNKFVDPDSIVVSGPAPTPTPTPVPVKPCPDPKAHDPKPPLFIPDRGELMDEGRALDAFYTAPEGLQREPRQVTDQDGNVIAFGGGLSIDGRPDWEGIAAWLLDIYLKARIAGKSREEARELYREQIRGSAEWKAKHAA